MTLGFALYLERGLINTQRAGFRGEFAGLELRVSIKDGSPTIEKKTFRFSKFEKRFLVIFVSLLT